MLYGLVQGDSVLSMLHILRLSDKRPALRFPMKVPHFQFRQLVQSVRVVVAHLIVSSPHFDVFSIGGGQ